MVFKKVTTLVRSLIFRLVFWYSLALLMLFCIIFTLLFINAKTVLHGNATRRLEAEIAELESAYRSEGLAELDKVIARTAHTHGIGEVCYSVFDANGTPLFSSDMSQWPNLKLDRGLLKEALETKQHIIRIFEIPGIDPHVQVAYVALTNDKILRTATVLRYTDAFLADLQKGLTITAIVVMLMVIIVGTITLHWLINRVKRVTNTAVAISSTSMANRVPVTGSNDEIDKLARAFNEMLDRIGLLVKGLGEITDNVAHDLKLPLTRIRIIAESLLKTHPADETANQFAADIMEESDRLIEMINTTLEIRAIDIGAASLNFEKIDLSKIVLEACELFEMIAQEKGVSFNVHANGSIIINGDLRHLQRVFANLIDNAIKYTDAQGKVEVQIQYDQNTVRIVITDTGPGIAPESLDRIFERFYRADQSRTVPGIGLGLSLAESIIKAHGGRITVESAVGIGSKFTVILPRNVLIK
jgi:signal transduction histidine kinase